jgi:hypothetical protein
MRLIRSTPRSRGQALAEFALVFPIFVLVLFGIIVTGLYVFYQQQLTNAAREGARYAALHSSTAQCPTVSHEEPIDSHPSKPDSYYACDADPWPLMTAHARSYVWGIAPTDVEITACWSSYHDSGGAHDALPVAPDGTPNTLVRCTIGGVDPHADQAGLACPAGTTVDQGSNVPNNQVSVYACMRWQPPMAGVLMMPNEITMRAVITEVIQRQQ